MSTRLRLAAVLSCALLAAACAHPDSGQVSPDAGAPAAASRAAPAATADPPPPPHAPEQPISEAADSATREVTPDPVVRSYLPSSTSPAASNVLSSPAPAPPQPGTPR